MISNLQFLRALAALGVVFYHTAFQINGVHTDFMGVCVFFVISGFIMTHVSRKSADLFMTKRLVRIVPLYWVCTLIFLAWQNLGLANPLYTFPLFWKWVVSDPGMLLVWVKQNYGFADSSAQWKLVKSLLFVPYMSQGSMHPLLGVGWTLNLEMFFYVLFAAALKISERWAPAMVVLALALVKMVAFGIEDPTSVLKFYGHPYTVCFVIGVACFYGWRAIESRARAWRADVVSCLAVLYGACYLALCLQMIVISEPASVTQEVVGMASAGGVVFFALILHSAGVRCRSAFLLLLGNASYALYLTHLIVIGTMATLGQRWPWLNLHASAAGTVAAIVISIALALIVYRYIEIPLLAVLRRRFEPSPRGGVSTAAA